MTSDATMTENPALVTRTEYTGLLVRIREVSQTALLFGSVPVLAILALAGVDPETVVLLAGGSVTASFAARLLFRGARSRSAVRLGLVDGQILIGTEDTGDVVRPLTELTDVALSRKQSPATNIDPGRRELRVKGVHYLQLTFRDGDTHFVAMLEKDAVADEIYRRLKYAIPGKSRTDEHVRPAGRQSTSTRSSTKTPSLQVPPVTRTSSVSENQPDAGSSGPSPSPAADIRLWEAAGFAHRRVLSEYGAYELDPALYLRYPGVTDVTREPVMDFHAALEDAQALATDGYPGDAEYAGRYRGAVETLRRTWVRCERDGKATGSSYLADEDSSDLETAAKLYKHAQSTDQPAEKVAYLRKVQQIVVELDGRGRLHLPAPVVATIETQVRRALEPGRTGD